MESSAAPCTRAPVIKPAAPAIAATANRAASRSSLVARLRACIPVVSPVDRSSGRIGPRSAGPTLPGRTGSPRMPSFGAPNLENLFLINRVEAVRANVVNAELNLDPADVIGQRAIREGLRKMHAADPFGGIKIRECAGNAQNAVIAAR